MGRTSSGSSDGSLLIPIDKASTIHAVEEANPIRTETQTQTEAVIQALRKHTPVQAPAQYDTHDGLLNILSDDLVQPHDHVIIIDSMAVVRVINSSTSRMPLPRELQGWYRPYSMPGIVIA